MRLVLKLLGGALILGILLLAFRLVPPHLQIGSVEPRLPSEARLRGLLTVRDGPVRLRVLNTSSQQLPDGELGHTVFIAEWANGNLFMIDAGMDREAAIEFGRLMELALGAEEAVSHGSIDQLLGADTMRVQGVAFTHLHIDHTQGIKPFCEARGSGASVYQTSWQKDLLNFNTTEGAAIVANSCLAEGQMVGDELLEIADFPGLGIAGLGGHTPGSTLFAIALNDRIWILSGDITNAKADLRSDTGKGFLYSYLLVPENTARTAELRQWLLKLDSNDDMTILVSHDVGEVLASGIVEFGR